MTPPPGAADGDAIIALNAGSSSIKFGLYSLANEPRLIVKGEVEHPSPEGAGSLLAAIQTRLDGRRLVAAGHRVVHGGSRFAAPLRLTPRTIAELEALTPLAPLHQPLCLAPITALAQARPNLPQIACFDTAFHHELAPPVSRYALPLEYEDKGIRKYGFHGLSYEYIARHLREFLPHLVVRKTVVAHLGNGASLCAMQDGRSLDTTMGFSVLDGLMMGTRPGAIDPGVLIYLLEEEGLSPEALQNLLYHKSGLFGVSGFSGDMRELLATDTGRAREAVDLFVFRITREVAAMANTLGGLEALIFTGGIGEHAAPIRRMVCSRLHWLGLEIDAQANKDGVARLDTPQSAVSVWVIPTDEERVIAGHTAALVAP